MTKENYGILATDYTSRAFIWVLNAPRYLGRSAVVCECVSSAGNGSLETKRGNMTQPESE